MPSGPSDRSRLSPAAVSYTATDAGLAASLAQRTVDEGYGVFLTYNLTESDTSAYLSGITDKLYGSATVYTP